MTSEPKVDLNQIDPFKKGCESATIAIRSTIIDYLNIFKCKTVTDLISLFNYLEVDSNTICAKKMQEVGGWRCSDCVKNDTIIFCQDCWSKMREKHEGHNIIFLNRVNGTCDCGDHNCIDKEYFCPNHKGIIAGEAEIKEYINRSLGESIANGIKSLTEEMFDGMFLLYSTAINIGKTESKEFTQVIKDFIDTFGLLCELSKACNFIICDLLLKKYPFKTKHTCLNIEGQKGTMTKASLVEHDCTCPFIRFILEFWPGKKEKLLYRLILNYELKKYIGLYFFLFYNEYFKRCIIDFGDISVQIIFKDVIEIACNIPGLIDTVYDGMVEIIETFVNVDTKKSIESSSALDIALPFFTIDKRFGFLKEIINNVKCDTIYIIKPVSQPYLSNNTNIIFKLIDMVALLHNINPIKVITPRPETKQEYKFLVDILDIEIWLLDIFSLYVTLFNFDNIDIVKQVFSYFTKAIQNPKIKLGDDEYTFHITLYRAFSIFLNRYCFHEANKANSNVFKTLKNVDKLMPSFQECSKEMIKSIFKVFGFITACGEGFFIYYGESMSKYEYLYYYNRDFIYRDFCLLKYLLALKENAEYLGFKTILKLCQVENSDKPIEEYILKGDKIASPDLWLNDSNKQYLKFSSKILFIILSLLRNNTSLIWNLGASYDIMKGNKIPDILIGDILKKDQNNFLELTKELIINEILIKENLAYFTDITDNIFLCLKDFFGEKNITDLIISLTNKTLTKDKKAKFALKDELLYYLDLNYIIYPIFKSKAEKYISDFKSKQVSIFNIYFYPVNKFELKLNEENFNRLYFNDNNFDFLFKFTSFILTQKGYEILNEYFLSVLLNYLSTFLCIENDHFVFLRENLQTNEIIQVLENNNLNDEVKKSYCQFIVQKFKEQTSVGVHPSNTGDNTNKISDNKELRDSLRKKDNVQPVRKSMKLTMKEKMQNKFKKKNDHLSDKLGLDKIVIEEVKKDTESCIYCLKPIDINDITNPFGVIGDFMFDNYTSNAFFQTIKKEYRVHYDNDLKLPEFNQIYYQPLERRSIKIISCNHYIHFTCFFKKFMDSDLMASVTISPCPLCNRLSETCVPMLVQYTNEQTKGFFKGFDFNYVFDYGKTHIEEYEKKIQEERKKEEKEEEKEKEQEQKDKETQVDMVKEEGTPEEKKEKVEKEEEPKDKEMQIDNDKKELEPENKTEEKKQEPEKEQEPKDKESKIEITPVINKEAEDFRKAYPDIVNCCKHFVEGFVGVKAGFRNVDIEDVYIKPIIAKFSSAFAVQYKELFCYLDNIEEKNFSVTLWKNFVLSMKLMLKLDIITKESYILRLFKMLKEFITLKFDQPIKDIIQLDNVKLRTCEILLLLTILFDYENIQGYEKYILYMMIPIYAFGFFLKNIYFMTSFCFEEEIFLAHLNSDELYKFLKEDTTLNNIIIQIVKQLVITKVVMNKNIDLDKLSLDLNDNLDLLNLPSLKNKTLLEILDELDILIKADSTNEKMKHLYDNFKLNNDYKTIFQLILQEHIEATNSKTLDKVLSPSLFGSCLPNKFEFVTLPELAIDLEYLIYNIGCQMCNAKGKRSLICLDCGRKVCDSRSCLAEFKGEKMASFFVHCKVCGGGRTAYLQSHDCSVLFISNKAVFRKCVPLYVNEFGEGINKRSFGKEYKLNKEEVKKALKMFTEYSYSNAEINL